MAGADLDTFNSSFNAAISIRSDDCSAAEADFCQAGPCEGKAQWAGELGAGRHFIIVDGADAATAGAFYLHYSLAPLCTGGRRLEDVVGSVEGDTCIGDESFKACDDDAYINGKDDLYWFLECPRAGGAEHEIRADTCQAGAAFTPILSLFRGTCAWQDNWTCLDNLDCDNGEGLTTSVPEGLYFLVVDGRGPEDCGTYALEYDLDL